MRWKLLKRRLTISAPTMAVQSAFSWPLRWALTALMLGFSAAIALWAFELGKGWAGLDREAKQELVRLRVQFEELKTQSEKSQSIVNTADSMLKAEQAAQQKMVEQIKTLEAENRALKDDLGFFERLLPTGAGQGLSINRLQGEMLSPGHLKFQVLVMQSDKKAAEFNGKLELTLSGMQNGKPWTFSPPAQALQVKQYRRLEQVIEVPVDVSVKNVQARVLGSGSSVLATQSAKM